MTGERKLVMYTRAGCGLCEDMLDDLAPWLEGGDLRVDLVDIGQDPGLQKQFGLRIPVLFLDGHELCYGRLDPDLLQQALTAH